MKRLLVVVGLLELVSKSAPLRSNESTRSNIKSNDNSRNGAEGCGMEGDYCPSLLEGADPEVVDAFAPRILKIFKEAIQEVSPEDGEREGVGAQALDYEYFDNLREFGQTADRTSAVVEVRDFSNGRKYELRSIVSLLPMSVPVPGGRIIKPTLDAIAAALMAIHHFNTGDGSIVSQFAEVALHAKCPNLKFTFEAFDTQYSPRTALAALNNQVLPRFSTTNNNLNSHQPAPTALIGSLRSAVSEIIASITGARDLPQISPTSTSETFENKDQYPLFGRLVAAPNADALAVVQYLNKLKVTHFCILFSRDLYGISLSSNIQHIAEQDFHMNVVLSSIDYVFTDHTTVSDAIRPLKQSQYHYFVGIFSRRVYDSLMPEAAKHGLIGPGNFWLLSPAMRELQFTTYPTSENHTYQASIDAANGSALITPRMDLTDLGAQGQNAFLHQWNQIFLNQQHNNTPHNHSVLATSARNLFNKVIHRSGIFSNPQDLESFSFSTYPLTLAHNVYDSVTATLLAACYATAVDNIISSSSSSTSSFTGQDLFHQFRTNVQFNGVTGHVKFDPHTGSRDPTTVPFVIQRFIPILNKTDGSTSFRIVPSEVYKVPPNSSSGTPEWISISNNKSNDGEDDHEDESVFVYADGTTIPPSNLPPIQSNTNDVQLWSLVMGSVLCALALALSTLWFVWTARNCSTHVILASQPIFLFLLCGGAFVMGLSIIPMLLEGNQSFLDAQGRDIACMAVPWLFNLGFVIAFSALFSKTRRINKIFHTKVYTRMKVKALDVMIPFFILFSTNVLLLTLWTVFAPLHYHRVELPATDKFGRKIESYAICYSSETKQITFLVSVACVNFGALVYAIVQAIEARSITTEYSESRYIASSMIIIGQAFLLGIPWLIMTVETPTASFFVRSTLVFITCVAILLPMFVPKIIHVKRWKQLKREKEIKRNLRMLRQLDFDARVQQIHDIDRNDDYGYNDLSLTLSHNRQTNITTDDEMERRRLRPLSIDSTLQSDSAANDGLLVTEIYKVNS